MLENRAKRIRTYQDLLVYQRAYSASLEVHRLLVGRRDEVSEQIRRATKSIPANLAEAMSRANTGAEAKRILAIALRECDEVRVWLDYCRDLALLSKEVAERLGQEYREIGAMLYRLWHGWRQRRSI